MNVTALLLALMVAVVSGGTATAEQPAATSSDCATCHEETAVQFAKGPHGRAMARTSPETLARSCTGCHGDAAEHLQDPTTANIRRIPGPEVCAACHEKAAREIRLLAAGHAHGERGCLECHASGHQHAAERLLATEPAALCGRCHSRETAAASLPFAHRQGREPFPCTACHSAHDTGAIDRPSILGVRGPCAGCHADKAALRVFEHPPREASGCTSCHAAHGSPNARMLVRHDPAILCIECHANLPSSHDLNRGRYRACTTCHAAIHGSNRNSLLFDD